MTLHTRVAGVEDSARMQEELVSLLAERGVLHCLGVVAAVLDTGEAIANTARGRAGQAGTGQAEAGRDAP